LPLDRLAYLEAAFRLTPDQVVILAPNGTLLDANRSALEFGATTLDAARGTPWWTAPGIRSRPALAEWLEEAIEQRARPGEVSCRLELTADDGSRRRFQFRLRALAMPDGAPSVLQLVGGEVPVEERDDTAQVERARAALQESEARFRAALDAGQDAFVIAGAVRDIDGALTDFVVLDANARAGALVDVSPSALVGRSLFEAFPLSRETGLFEQCSRVVATRVPYEMAQAFPLPNLPDRWVQRQIVPLGDGVAISSRDVSSRRREQEALEASEVRHRQLFESSGAIQLIVDDASGALIDVNPAAEMFYGWPRETMRGMLLTDLDAPTRTADAPEYDTHATLASPDRRAVTRVHRVASGVRRDVEYASSPVVIDGRLARHLIIHDVSDRVRAEAQLRESEARFRSVINDMSEGVVIHDAGGAIRVFNPSAETILGLTGAQLLGLQPVAREWEAVHDDGTPWPPAEHPAMKALRTGRSQARALMGVRRGDGAHAWLHVTADPLIRPGEVLPYAAVAVFSDVTAQRIAEQRLREAQKLEVVGQLAGGIAHDFNNLLTVIRGAAGFLRDTFPEDSPARDDVRAIERATERAEELTRRLLAIGRRQMLRPETVDLAAFVQEQVPAIRDAMPASIRVQAETRDGGVLARLDRQQLLDALRALVDNARDAMTDGGTLTIRTRSELVARSDVESQRRDAHWYTVLEVCDTGAGMSEEIRARLFEPFFSTQPFGGNHGMGLASVHGMVAQSHGYIECDTAPGAGTSLRLFFPSATQSDRAITPSRASRAVASHGVLLVDDDALVRDLGRRMLDRLGHSVAVAASGSEALAQLALTADSVTVVVTDLTMPSMSGMELIAEMERLYPHIPVVAMSGFAMNPAVRQELEHRRIPFVSKPFSASDLSDAVGRAVSSESRRSAGSSTP
jgi:PAS domain S-box-containing protein